MSQIEHNLCENWGWYVDLDNEHLNNNNKSQYFHKPQKYFINDLDTINEYEYYEEKYNYYNDNVERKKINKTNYWDYISSTLYGASMTYIVFLVVFKQWDLR